MLTAHAEGVVDQERYAVLVRHVCDLLQRRDVELRVSDALDVHGLGLLVDRSGELRGVFALHELHGDVELLQEDCGRLLDIRRALGPSRRAHL